MCKSENVAGTAGPAYLHENFPRMTKEKPRKSENAAVPARSGLSTREFSENDPRKTEKIRECCWAAGLKNPAYLHENFLRMTQEKPRKSENAGRHRRSKTPAYLHENFPKMTREKQNAARRRRSKTSAYLHENSPRMKKTEKVRECC